MTSAGLPKTPKRRWFASQLRARDHEGSGLTSTGLTACRNSEMLLPVSTSEELWGQWSHFESHAADQRLAHELGRIGMALLTDSSSYPDVSRFTRSPSEKKPGRVERPRPLDPEALLVSLRDSYISSSVRYRGTASDDGIDGVFRALFAQMDDENAETHVMDEVGEGPSPAPSDRIVRVVTEDPPNAVDQRASRILQNHMERFLGKYEAQEYVTACTGTQLAQATAYPIATAVMGERRGWCTREQRRGWVAHTARVLLTGDPFHQREALLECGGPTLLRRRAY